MRKIATCSVPIPWPRANMAYRSRASIRPSGAGRFQDRQLKPGGYDEQLPSRAIRCAAPPALLSALIPHHISKLQEDGLPFSGMMIVTTQ